MATSPTLHAEGSLRFTVKCDGQPITAEYQLIGFVSQQQVNRIGKAELRFKASVDDASQVLELEGDMFLPGVVVSVAGGYGETEDVLFEGKIVAVQLSINDYEGPVFAVECRDYAYSMTQAKADAVFEDLSHTDIIKEVLARYPDIEADVQAGGIIHERLIQYQQTDWDFLLGLAKSAGSVVVMEGSKISVSPPKLSARPTLKVTYGLDMLVFRAELSAEGQTKAVEARAWDPTTQSLAAGRGADAALNDHGNISVDTLAEAVNVDTRILHAANPDQEMLDKMAAADKLSAGLARIRGTCTFPGSAKAKVGDLIELVGVGTRFSGSAYVGGVTHDFDESGWTTTVSIGLPSTLPSTVEAGLSHGGGLHIAVVVKIDEDPQRQNRIAIELPILDQPGKRIWARLASPWASETYGMLSIPDVGDEVVVGFLQADPSEPIIVGSLYSSKRMPKLAWDAENNWHGLHTKTGIVMGVDDKEKAFHMETPGGISIRANDTEKSLSLKDMNGNVFQFSADGIVLKSDKGIQVESEGDIQLKASKKLDQKGALGTTIVGQNVDIKADMAASVKGSASAELSASGQTTVKGAMVMIN